jgi:hypothetical protein
MTDKIPDFVIEGREIYNQMREKYPTDSPEDTDHILRTLSVSLGFLVYHNVLPRDYEMFLNLVKESLGKIFNMIKIGKEQDELN